MANKKLIRAKKEKMDEYYTQWNTIEREIESYIEYNPDVFRDKTILCPCDDPEWSNFTKYFVLHFQEFGIKKLISTSYASESKLFKYPYQLTLFEFNNGKYDSTKSKTNGKIFVLDRDNKGNNFNINDLKWDYLENDGSFLSDEVTALRNEADLIITNPPFSIFRTFLEWVIDAKKDFLVIANKSCVSYKEIFPLIRNNLIWSGRTEWSGGMWFETKDNNNVDKIINEIPMKNTPSIWITNIDHGRRHQPLSLMTMEENIKFSKHRNDIKWNKVYKKYDNFNAIEVPFTDSIPSDYKGIMGVPISFLDKYCPDQFEIIGNEYELDIEKGRGYIDGMRMYSRIFIRRK